MIKVTHEEFMYVCTGMLSNMLLGDKGDSGKIFKGEKGNDGLPGPMGPKGEQGDKLIFSHIISLSNTFTRANRLSGT